ncbi:hypothetical protein [Pedobacter nutrimenti]|uniref:DUF7677 family protein n=1 Tax=Pedobacter nutrimenti TaxID=1241337 RepID=UPI00292F8ED1|nr:hypothetical protein [Pedobacter nutrimenti]
MKLSKSFNSAFRKFAYFLSSGNHHNLEGINYLALYGEEPSAIEQAYVIFINVLEMDDEGTVLNASFAEIRATDYLREYCDKHFVAEPPYKDWELALH